MCWFGELFHHTYVTLVVWTLADMRLNPILRGKDGLSLLLQFIPLGQGCDLSLDAFNHFGFDWRALLWMICLGRFIVVVLLIYVITTGCVIIIRFVRSWANICWILSKTFCWALEVCSCASMRWRRSSSLLLSAILADTNLAWKELMVAEEA